MSEERFRIGVAVDAPIEAVWRALREPARVRRWHGWDDPGLDDEVRAIYFDGVSESEADHTLEVQGGDRFELSGLGGRTLVRLTRAPRGGDPEWDAYYEDVDEGWLTFLQQLRFALERHPEAGRRTVFLSGEPRDGAVPITRLALPDAPTPITGTVWFRSEHQVGLTVDEWGDGLLVLAEQPPAPSRPRGGAMAILTTYGLDDGAFEALRMRWSKWWEARHPQDEPPKA